MHMAVESGGDAVLVLAEFFELRHEVARRHHLALTPDGGQARLVVDQHHMGLAGPVGVVHLLDEPVELLLHVRRMEQAATAVVVAPARAVVHRAGRCGIGADDAQPLVVECIPMQRMPGRSVARQAREILAVVDGPLVGLFELDGQRAVVFMVAGGRNQGHMGEQLGERAEHLLVPARAVVGPIGEVAREDESRHIACAGLRIVDVAVLQHHAVFGDALHDLHAVDRTAILRIGDHHELGLRHVVTGLGPGLEMVGTGELGRVAVAGDHGVFIQRVRFQALQIGKEDAGIGKGARGVGGIDDGERARAARLAHPDRGRWLVGLQHHGHAIGTGALQRRADQQAWLAGRVRQLGRIEGLGRCHHGRLEQIVVHRPVPVVAGVGVVPAHLRRGCACGRCELHGAQRVERVHRERARDGGPLVEGDGHIGRLRALALAVMRVEREHVAVRRADRHLGRDQRGVVVLVGTQTIRLDQRDAARRFGEFTAIARRGLLGRPGIGRHELPAQPFGRPRRDLHVACRTIGIKGLDRPARRRRAADLGLDRRVVEILLHHDGLCLCLNQTRGRPGSGGPQATPFFCIHESSCPTANEMG